MNDPREGDAVLMRQSRHPIHVGLWLDVDMKLRELSRDRRSLDDFARHFFGIGRGKRSLPRINGFRIALQLRCLDLSNHFHSRVSYLPIVTRPNVFLKPRNHLAVAPSWARLILARLKCDWSRNLNKK